MKTAENIGIHFAVCVNNANYPASLELHKIYQVLPDETAKADGDIRVIDESGEDYLYPASYFVAIDLSEELKEKTLAAKLNQNYSLSQNRMTTFLFWNLNRKPLQSLIANLAHQYRIDVLMFAECIIPPDVMLLSLNRDGGALYDYAPIVGCEKIYIFTRFSHQFIPPVLESDRTTIRHLRLPGLEPILLVIVHLPDKGSWKESSQVSGCYGLANLISQAEKTIGHCKTVLVGDLNMNPFEAGVVDANGLHGVMSRQIAQSKTRVIQKQDYQFFYNPMWNLLGDDTPGSPGTYYRRNAEPVEFFWYMLDQVLIRPDLLGKFSNKSLKIITHIDETSLLSSSGLPDRRIASDHLPILFKLEL